MTAHDDDSAEQLASVIGDETVACAESCTAGRVSMRLAAVDGSGTWFRGGLVTYQTDTKRALLGVTAQSVYSEAAVRQMAAGAARVLDATAAVATSGVVGPDTIEGVTAGTVFVGCVVDGVAASCVVHCTGEPADVADAASTAALAFLAERLAEHRRATRRGSQTRGVGTAVP